MKRIKIKKKIVDYRVSAAESSDIPDTAETVEPKAVENPETKVVRMHERLERPGMLRGSTYKIKTPISDHAMYITINDIVLNPGTEFEKYRPYEIFRSEEHTSELQSQ